MEGLQYLKPLLDLSETMQLTNYDNYYDCLATFGSSSPIIGFGNSGCLLRKMDEEQFAAFPYGSYDGLDPMMVFPYPMDLMMVLIL